MKFRVMMVASALNAAIDEVVEKSLVHSGLCGEERQAVLDLRSENVKLAGKWFEDGEYLTVEIDTEAKTCTVVERGKR